VAESVAGETAAETVVGGRGLSSEELAEGHEPGSESASSEVAGDSVATEAPASEPVTMETPAEESIEEGTGEEESGLEETQGRDVEHEAAGGPNGANGEQPPGLKAATLDEQAKE